MEKQAFIAVVISILIIILYQEYMRRFYPPVQPPAKETATRPSEERPAPQVAPERPPAPTAAPAEVARGVPVVPVREVTVETPDYIALFTNQGARLKSFRLKRYRAGVEAGSPLIDMVSRAPGMEYPLGLRLADTPTGTDQGVVYEVRGVDLNLQAGGGGGLTFIGATPSGQRVVKEFTFSGSSYAVEVGVSIAGSPQGATLLFTTGGKNKGVKGDALFEGLIALREGDLTREWPDDIEGRLNLNAPLSWAGFGYTYFVSALIPRRAWRRTPRWRQVQGGIAGSSWKPAAGSFRVRNAPPATGSSWAPRCSTCSSPLTAVVEQSIDFGYFGFISVPMLHALHFFQTYTGNYGLDIILLTLIIKLLLWPLTQKSFVSMKRMQKLQPQMQRLKEKFGDDKTRLNKEMMDLYKRNKVNPLGGCLPMLLQFPFFIGFYNALLTPIELRHASFLWIKDLSRPDWESLPFSAFGYEVGIPVLVLLMGASMFIQQWMSPAIGDPNQRRMMMLMPLIFTVIFVSFPVGTDDLLVREQPSEHPSAIHESTGKSVDGLRPAAPGPSRPVDERFVMRQVEMEGETLDEAITKALNLLGVERDKVSLDILAEEKMGPARFWTPECPGPCHHPGGRGGRSGRRSPGQPGRRGGAVGQAGRNAAGGACRG